MKKQAAGFLVVVVLFAAIFNNAELYAQASASSADNAKAAALTVASVKDDEVSTTSGETTTTSGSTTEVSYMPEDVEWTVTENSDGTSTYSYTLGEEELEYFCNAATYAKNGFRYMMRTYLAYAGENYISTRYYYIKVEAGTYNIPKTSNGYQLMIYSNTTLDMTGCTITTYKASNDGTLNKTADNTSVNKLLISGNPEEGYSGYDDMENITVIGGTWDCSTCTVSHPIFQMAHVTNLTIKNVTLQNVYDNHIMEMAAVNGVTIKNCTFKNQRVGAGTNCREAIQIDINSTSFGDYNTEGKYKALGCKNVEVVGCTFDRVVQGIGSHTYSSSYPHTGIVVHGNTFTNVSKSGTYENIAIHPYCWKSSKIYNNTIKTVKGSAIVVNGTCSSMKIYSNKISDAKYCGISIRSYGSVTSIYKNTISSCGTEGIYMYLGSASTIYSNTIKSCSAEGIELDYHSNVTTIRDNTLKSNKASGIYLSNSKATTIKTNAITKCGSPGIKLSSSNVNTLKKNTIKKCGGTGILVSGSAVTALNSNTIGSASSNAVKVSGASTVTKIKSNTISGNSTTKIGLFVTGKSTVNKVLSNTFKKCTKYGICVKKKSKVKKTSGNKFKSCKTKTYCSSNSTLK
ncbi:MAG: right-handed parallel beta-helix repeat-containing protein [Eubacterium sp.]|nr:right-handed parallel beta-helix repeat-containing protein [Eubacterium sp.]